MGGDIIKRLVKKIVLTSIFALLFVFSNVITSPVSIPFNQSNTITIVQAKTGSSSKSSSGFKSGGFSSGKSSSSSKDFKSGSYSSTDKNSSSSTDKNTNNDSGSYSSGNSGWGGSSYRRSWFPIPFFFGGGSIISSVIKLLIIFMIIIFIIKIYQKYKRK